MNAGIQEGMRGKRLESEDFSPRKAKHMKELQEKKSEL